MGRKHTWKDYGVNKKDLDRAVAVKHVIDCNKRKNKDSEPKFTD